MTGTDLKKTDNKQEKKTTILEIITKAKALKNEKDENGNPKYEPEEVLSQLSVEPLVKKKQNKDSLSYLKWSDALAIFLAVYPTGEYKVIKHQDATGVYKPWLIEAGIGVVVETEISINGRTRACQLPVLDHSQKSMKEKPSTYKNSNGEDKYINAVTTFDINTATQRCFVKNLAMWGLGLSIYRGMEDPLTDLEVTYEDQYDPIEIDNMKESLLQKMEEDKAYLSTQSDVVSKSKLLNIEKYKQKVEKHVAELKELGKEIDNRKLGDMLTKLCKKYNCMPENIQGDDDEPMDLASFINKEKGTKEDE